MWMEGRSSLVGRGGIEGNRDHGCRGGVAGGTEAEDSQQAAAVVTASTQG